MVVLKYIYVIFMKKMQRVRLPYTQKTLAFQIKSGNKTETEHEQEC